MEHMVFSAAGRSSHTPGLLSQLNGHASKNYYNGDLVVDDRDLPDLEIDMAKVMPYPSASVVSRSPYAFRRSWDHIRSNKDDLICLRYVKRGTMKISQQNACCQATEGDFVFTRSNIPFLYESLATKQLPTEFLFVLLPPSLVHGHFPDGVPLCMALSAPSGQRLAMPTLLTTLCEKGENLDREVIELVIRAVMKEAEGVVQQQGAQVAPRQTIRDKRIEEIRSFIALHMSNPDFSSSLVADGCNISPRYLCIFKSQGTTFSKVLWDERLEKARDWLVALDARHYTIGEIAFMTGYKNVAHFSRMFRNRFGCSPREYRSRESEKAAVADRALCLEHRGANPMIAKAAQS